VFGQSASEASQQRGDPAASRRTTAHEPTLSANAIFRRVFPSPLRSSAQDIPMRSRHRAAVEIDQMMLLISAAALHHRFRFAAKVTNLQQTAAAPSGEAMTANDLRRPFSARSGRHAAAEGLSKVWRFFITYAMVETGPVSRHVPSTPA
jgi:hypothetical protein